MARKAGRGRRVEDFAGAGGVQEKVVWKRRKRTQMEVFILKGSLLRQRLSISLQSKNVDLPAKLWIIPPSQFTHSVEKCGSSPPSLSSSSSSSPGVRRQQALSLPQDQIMAKRQLARRARRGIGMSIMLRGRTTRRRTLRCGRR